MRFLSKPIKKGTVFIGPDSQREVSIEKLLQEKNAKWSTETEANYFDNIRNKATAKVRAMLVQAQKRGNEIIEQAENNAGDLRERLQAEIEKAEEYTQKAKAEYENAFQRANQDAHRKMKEQLEAEKRQLGEGTAVVLLSIHEQTKKIFEAWKDDLLQLSLEAINVGTGWIADSQRKEILTNLLFESVRKLIEKKEYIVRVNSVDGDLVNQVLENSREKSWTVEIDNDLEPGSLEIENSNAFIKNNSKERKEFVQGILDNLILPPRSEEQYSQNVTDTLMSEIQKSPLLSKVTSDEQAVEDEQAQPDLEDFYQEPVQTPEQTHESEQEQVLQTTEKHSSDGQEVQPDLKDQDIESQKNESQDIKSEETESKNDIAPDLASELEMLKQSALEDLGEPEPREQNPPLVDPVVEAEDIVNTFLDNLEDDLPPVNNSIDNFNDDENSFPKPPEQEEQTSQQDQSSSVKNEASKKNDAQAEIDLDNDFNELPQNLADDLLAEMGFDLDNKE